MPGPTRNRIRLELWLVPLALAFCLLVSLPAEIQAQTETQKQPPSSNTQEKPQEKTGGSAQKPAEKPPAPPAQQPAPLQLEAPKQAPALPAQKPAAPPAQKPAAPAPVQQNKQPLIEAITFRGNRRIPASTLRARIFSHAGDVYDENALERDFMALWNTGFFDDIRLEATDAENGNKILTFFVREKKLIRSIDNKGLSTVSWSDVLDEFKKRKVGLSIESQYDPVVVKRAQVVIKELLAVHGREFATVRTRTRNIPPNSVALTFIVVEGPKVKVGSIRFQGNAVFSSRRLVREMKLTRPAGAPPWFYWFHKTYDRDKVLFDLEKVRELYQNHGYFYALPKDPIVKMTDTRHRLWPFFFFSFGRGKRVDLTIPIEEGAQYRLGQFHIRGNKVFKTEVLARVLQMKTGDIFSRGKVTKAIETYSKLYGQFGYINFTANPDIDPDNRRHLVNLALDFDEGRQFTVHRIEFSGNTKTRDKVIRRELLVEEGSVFNTTWWELSVLRVNQLGFFDEVKKEDYQVQQNAKERTVDITLKVKEKGKNSIGFSGGLSGLAGNFVGINYATNNFLGLGETLSLEMQVGTFEKLYSFGFTEPYLFDRPITAGFTIFKSSFRFDQLRQAALFSGINPGALQQSPFGQFFFQNFSQSSSGFTSFASYPLRRSFARVGLTYSFTRSSIQTFNAASNLFFQSLAFRQFQGPNALSGIVESSIMPTYTYNTINDPFNPKSGKSVFAALGFSSTALGGNVNTIRPVFEFKYWHPVNHGRNAVGFHFLGSMVTGYGGRVAAPFSRFYIGGENDIRGFDLRSISPVVFFPTTGSVCNLDNTGKIIPALDGSGRQTGTCGSSTRFPFNTVIFPGGDTEVVTNFEYRIPIAGPVTLAYFVDAGGAFAARPGQLRISPSLVSPIITEFPFFPKPSQVLKPLARTNYKPRSSTGIEVQVILPIVNAPFRVYYGFNWLRLNTTVVPPQNLPPVSLFPNQATFDQVKQFFLPLNLNERRGQLGFTVARTF